jgi:hypothetical protein
VDLDPVDLHLQGYGFRGIEPDPLAYEVALPRLLERFARAGVRATWFVVGRDAEWQASALAKLVRDGHEVASHSHSHPLAFTRLAPAEQRAEAVESRRALERATHGEVVGFRAPNFDLDAHGLAVLAAAGYRYDASAYPTLMLIPARVLLALKSGDPAAVLRMRMRPLSFERAPHQVRAGAGSLVEFPTSVTPGTRIPVYHTMRFFSGRAAFEKRLAGFARRDEPLSYALHAVDALGLREDGVDRRLSRHPGMNVPLADKLRMLDESLAAIRARFEPAPFRDRLEALECG